ncbi:MAG: hypothetical protein H0W74_11120 [Sphingosinicella sp.]|nr:hypothetical protein [Sphingosinicella sp.]
MAGYSFAVWTAAALLALLPVQAQASGPVTYPAPLVAAQLRDGSRDFDFETGSWKAHISRRLRPLTGSNEWVEYKGSSVVRPVWGGKANLGELDVKGPAGKIQGLSLRLYDPQSRQWKISWANAGDGAITPAMIGQFDGKGRGEFYNEDVLDGRQIFVRFQFSDISQTSLRIEQAFSADAGKTWEVNWISTFER